MPNKSIYYSNFTIWPYPSNEHQFSKWAEQNKLMETKWSFDTGSEGNNHGNGEILSAEWVPGNIASHHMRNPKGLYKSILISIGAQKNKERINKI